MDAPLTNETPPPAEPSRFGMALLILALTLCALSLLGGLLTLVGPVGPAIRAAVATPRPNSTLSPTVRRETVTVVPTALPEAATATAEVGQSFLPRALAWRVILSDAFDKPANDWSVEKFTNDQGATVKSIAEGKYRWHLTANKPFVSRDIPTVYAGDYYLLSVDGRLTAGPPTCRYGLSWNDDHHSFYLFDIDDTGRWRLGRATTWTPLEIFAQASSPAIKAGQTNLVQVLVLGSSYSAFVNGQFAGRAEDSENAGDSVGIGVELGNAGDDCQFEFDNFEVRRP